MWQQWVNGILGIWVIIAPWLGLSYYSLAWVMVVTGIIIAILGFWGAATAAPAWGGYGSEYPGATGTGYSPGPPGPRTRRQQGMPTEQEMGARAGGAGPVSPQQQPTSRYRPTGAQPVGSEEAGTEAHPAHEEPAAQHGPQVGGVMPAREQPPGPEAQERPAEPAAPPAEEAEEEQRRAS